MKAAIKFVCVVLAAAFFFAAHCLLPVRASALELRIRNDFDKKMTVAVVYFDGQARKWRTLGWFATDPRSERKLTLDASSDNIYIYAQLAGLTMTWGTGDITRTVRTGAFSYFDGETCPPGNHRRSVGFTKYETKNNSFTFRPSLSLPMAESEKFSDVLAEVEKKYGVIIDLSEMDAPDSYKIEYIRRVEYELSLIPYEFHNAFMDRLKGQNKTLSFLCLKWLDGTSSWNAGKVRITLYDPIAVAHEYGHAVFEEIRNIYGADRFRKEWTALNNGIDYSEDINERRKKFDNNIFIRSSSIKNIREDVADTFGRFINRTDWIRIDYDRIENSNLLKKVLLFEKIAIETLNVNRIYLNRYVPQKPSSWAADSVKRAFVGGGDIWHKDRILAGIEDSLFYQEQITRLEFCRYIHAMLGGVSKKLWNEYFEGDRKLTYDKYGRLDKFTTNLTNLKTGEKSEQVNIPAVSADPSASLSCYLGLMTGENDGGSNPYGPLTREQAAVILTRVHKLLGLKDRGGKVHVPADVNIISAGAKADVDHALRNGIMSVDGDKKFAPQRAFTYEETIAVLVRLYEMTVL
jgi:hypothetical protein